MNRFLQPLFEIVFLFPSEFALDFVAIDRIAAIMTGPVIDKGDQILDKSRDLRISRIAVTSFSLTG